MNQFGVKETSCDCIGCREMCEYKPCWGTPDEMQKIIKAGFGNRLMLDWWVGGGSNGDNILILSPAIRGCEKSRAPEYIPTGPCAFHTRGGKCSLHKRGLKPVEGRSATHEKDVVSSIHKKVAMTWNNPKAQKLVAQWAKKYKLEFRP